MPQLVADFENDWLLHLRDRMINDQGWLIDELSGLNAQDIGFRYFDAIRRKGTSERTGLSRIPLVSNG